MQMLDTFLAWCNQENPQTESEMMLIRYGAELLIDNGLKIIFLITLGFVLGKGLESVVFLLAFCTLRSQVGGYHARTGWGCGLCMLCVWAIGLSVAEWMKISLIGVLILALFLIPITIWKTPKTINRHCYTATAIKKAKIYATVILGVCIGIAAIHIEWRSLIMCAVTLEVMTLLPE